MARLSRLADDFEPFRAYPEDTGIGPVFIAIFCKMCRKRCKIKPRKFRGKSGHHDPNDPHHRGGD
jgi:hypothetical protein